MADKRMFMEPMPDIREFKDAHPNPTVCLGQWQIKLNAWRDAYDKALQSGVEVVIVKAPPRDMDKTSN